MIELYKLTVAELQRKLDAHEALVAALELAMVIINRERDIITQAGIGVEHKYIKPFDDALAAGAAALKLAKGDDA